MSGADYRIDVQGMAEVEQKLALLAARVGDLSPLMDDISSLLITDTQDNFIGEHAPDGTPWTPSQRAIRDGGKTLQDSRRLFLSIAGRSTATTAEVGTNVVYARAMQEGDHGTHPIAQHKRTMKSVFGVHLAEPIEVMVGAHTRKANTPARPFLGLSPHMPGDIEELAAVYVGAER